MDKQLVLDQQTVIAMKRIMRQGVSALCKDGRQRIEYSEELFREILPIFPQNYETLLANASQQVFMDLNRQIPSSSLTFARVHIKRRRSVVFDFLFKQ